MKRTLHYSVLYGGQLEAVYDDGNGLKQSTVLVVGGKISTAFDKKIVSGANCSLVKRREGNSVKNKSNHVVLFRKRN